MQSNVHVLVSLINHIFLSHSSQFFRDSSIVLKCSWLNLHAILEIVVVLNLVKIIDSKQLQLTPVSGMIACFGNEFLFHLALHLFQFLIW